MWFATRNNLKQPAVMPAIPNFEDEREEIVMNAITSLKKYIRDKNVIASINASDIYATVNGQLCRIIVELKQLETWKPFLLSSLISDVLRKAPAPWKAFSWIPGSLDVSTKTVYNILEIMEKNGMIERHGKEFSLTEKGKGFAGDIRTLRIGLARYATANRILGLNGMAFNIEEFTIDAMGGLRASDAQIAISHIKKDESVNHDYMYYIRMLKWYAFLYGISLEPANNYTIRVIEQLAKG